MQKWLPKIDSVKPFSMRTGVWIGTGNAFLRRRSRFARQVQHYHHDYRKFFQEVTRASRAVTFVATEILKNVLKLQGAPNVSKSRHIPHAHTHSAHLSTQHAPATHTTHTTSNNTHSLLTQVTPHQSSSHQMVHLNSTQHNNRPHQLHMSTDTSCVCMDTSTHTHTQTHTHTHTQCEVLQAECIPQPHHCTPINTITDTNTLSNINVLLHTHSSLACYPLLPAHCDNCAGV